MRRLERSFVSGRRGFATGSILALTLLLASGCAMFGGPDPEPRFVTVAVMSRGQSDVDLDFWWRDFGD